MDAEGRLQGDLCQSQLLFPQALLSRQQNQQQYISLSPGFALISLSMTGMANTPDHAGDGGFSFGEQTLLVFPWADSAF